MTSSELHCLSSTWLNEGRLGKRVSLAWWIGSKMSNIFGSFKKKYIGNLNDEVKDEMMVLMS